MKKIRFGIIGTNRISDWFLEGAMMDGRFELRAVCSRTMERAREFALRYDAPLAFSSLEDMVQSSEIDAVYIATPNSLHCEQAILCMEHGKHVLCEKPLASNAREVKLMMDAARRYGVVFMEAMKTTLTPGFRYLREHIGEVGLVRRYFASFCQYSSRYDSFKEGIVLNAFKPELSNGSVMDIGVYTIYPMVVLFGKPRSITATGRMLSTGVDGQGAALFDYEKMSAQVMYSKIADSRLPSEIQGEDGTVTISRISEFDDVRFYDRRDKGEEIWTPEPFVNGYYYELKEFIDVIESGLMESPINSLANSLATIEIIDEIRCQVGIRFPAD